MTPLSAGNGGVAPAQSWTESEFSSVLRSAQAGDGSAFERLYRWLAPQVTSFAAARGVEDAEGIANEVFLRVFGHVNRFDGDSGAFRSWIFAIARNQVVDAYRAQSRRPPTVSIEVPETPVEGAESQAMASLGAERVKALLSVLSADQRDVILLRMIADLSLRQVAIVIDKPVTAVKALQRRALRRLQSELMAEVVTR